ncbi:uncharacterized protein LOC116287678, partial [Actinia tenebrosa]|uniref:Uncharacterized protein LOC116287678 n=1 Tax=Actinia tenebrosa TaxID=6105 RepID=A0A6P8HC15_ACTTE
LDLYYTIPGRNCAVFGCGSCTRIKGIGIWKMKLAVDEKHREWREAWLGELKNTREIDSDFRDQIKNDRVYTCEKHFAPEDVEIFHTYKTTRRKPNFGALPKLNTPLKSIQTCKPAPRPERRPVQPVEATNVSINVSINVCYRTFSELCHRTKNLKSLSGI